MKSFVFASIIASSCHTPDPRRPLTAINKYGEFCKFDNDDIITLIILPTLNNVLTMTQGDKTPHRQIYYQDQDQDLTPFVNFSL